ncbi:MAG: hypothetical protein A2V92_05800 [Candidatus Muproteobacteria bacterium RBG_16_65_31]|uniref:DUF3047 domain-containing protein n=1 Tax=Candidatus Muproteobacteria bacterium RBG_16_65_31 TaxID=1817759 RepID=A0A1F6TJ26_9PROT|nr:MAG: hypothetical protein A2V92_05800 [Candidatus Muproteobacteria bacterium RBG_16_65_31]
MKTATRCRGCLAGFGLLGGWLLLPVAAGAEPAVVEVGKFSAAQPEQGLPEGWQPLIFPKIPRHTVYRLVRDGDTVVVRAEATASASGLTREIAVDPRVYPILEWRWKVSDVLQKGDVTRRDGDDYPARIYVTFAYNQADVGVLERARFAAWRMFYGHYPPAGAINYIWESRSAVGTIVPNPYTDRVRMIVVESGPDRRDQWRQERRDVYADYKQAFGREPPMISGVAIMTDTDNTGESVSAHYGDLVFRKAE